MFLNHPYPCTEGPEWTAVCLFTWIRDVEIMATGARRETEMFGRVDPVSPISVIR